MNEILKGVFVGDMSEASTAIYNEMAVLSVMADGEEGGSDRAHHIPTTTFHLDDGEMGFRTTADCQKLNEAADWILEQMAQNNRVLVHCTFGMQRSPLTVAWYMMRHFNYTLDDAFLILKRKRGMVQDRRDWLPLNWETMVKDGLRKVAA